MYSLESRYPDLLTGQDDPALHRLVADLDGMCTSTLPAAADVAIRHSLLPLATRQRPVLIGRSVSAAPRTRWIGRVFGRPILAGLAVVLLLVLPSILISRVGVPRTAPAPGAEAPPTLLRIPGGDGVKAIDLVTGRLFIAGQDHVAPDENGMITPDDTGTVSTVDLATRRLIRTVRIGWGPSDIAVAAWAGHVFVANSWLKDKYINSPRGTVSMIDARSGRLLRTITVADTPIAIQADPVTGRIFVLSGMDGGISMLDARTGRVIGTIDAGSHSYLVFTPTGLALDSKSGHGFAVLAAAQGDSFRTRIVMFDLRSGAVLRTLHDNLSNSMQAQGLTVDDAGGLLAASGVKCGPAKPGNENPCAKPENEHPCTEIFDTASGRLLYTVAGLTVTAVDPQRHYLFAARDNAIVVLDARTGRQLRAIPAVPKGQGPEILAEEQQSGRLLVTFWGPEDKQGKPTGHSVISIVDIERGAVVYSIPEDPGGAGSATVDARTGWAYVTTHLKQTSQWMPTNLDTVSVINMRG